MATTLTTQTHICLCTGDMATTVTHTGGIATQSHKGMSVYTGMAPTQTSETHIYLCTRGMATTLTTQTHKGMYVYR